jgi:tetratricopeptide (TPR) repeat protein
MRISVNGRIVAVFARLACAIGMVWVQNLAYADATACGPLTNHFGPFDYHASPPERRNLVERAHFTPDVERLRRGQTTAVIGADIHYTLMVFPNHPRALLAMSNLAQKEKLAKPAGSGFTVDCWFDRAVRFREEDATVRMLFGIYLLKTNRPELAVAQLEKASEFESENANLAYNLGLAYFDLHDYQKSLAFAHQAYEQGFPLPGLRNKLKRVGKWIDPVPKAKAVDEGSDSEASRSSNSESAKDASGEAQESDR